MTPILSNSVPRPAVASRLVVSDGLLCPQFLTPVLDHGDWRPRVTIKIQDHQDLCSVSPMVVPRRRRMRLVAAVHQLVGDKMFEFEGSRGEFLKLLGEFGEEPAFIRRANSVELSWEQLAKRCERERDDLLKWPRIHFGRLKRRLTGNWTRLIRFLVSPSDVSFFATFESRWGKTDEGGAAAWTDFGALSDFAASAARFDRRWTEFVEHMDLDKINQTRKDYNDYYPIERACAFGSERFNKDFEPLAMLRRDDLFLRFPIIDAPRLK